MSDRAPGVDPDRYRAVLSRFVTGVTVVTTLDDRDGAARPFGTTVTAGSSYGELESVKAVSDIIAPASGEVIAVNDKVSDAPELVNSDPYGDGWLIKVRLSSPGELDALMDDAAYREYLSGLSA